MIVKQSVSSTLARAFLYIVLVSLLSTGLALVTLSSSLRDAQAVNIAGSLRMQSYRMGYDLQVAPNMLPEHQKKYTASLNSPVFHALDHWYVPTNVRKQYAQIQAAWKEMQRQLQAGNHDWYHQNIANYVSNINEFVFALQLYAEKKVMLVAIFAALGFMTILLVIFFTLERIRLHVVSPLESLVTASKKIQSGVFHIPPLRTDLPNELGMLSRSFTAMTDELNKFYRSLEEKVTEKTLDLQQANRMLEVLYNCSQAMNTSSMDPLSFRHILQIIRQHEHVECIEMLVGENWSIREGSEVPDCDWQTIPVTMQDTVFGQLRWQAEPKTPPAQMMESIANMLGRGLFFNQAQKHYQQLLLMEERATIARELHDSLAQVLSYLRIQMALLNRSVPQENPMARQIIEDFSKALNDAYRQLRELLSTFRLTLQQADLSAALHEMIEPLRAQTTAQIHLDCRMPTQALDAQQQVHLLQLVREAVLNAIKHANASEISVSCISSPDGGHAVYVRDNGRGIQTLEEPAGHYGLNIMHERAQRLGGKLAISCPVTGGTLVSLSFSTDAGNTTGAATS